MNETNDNIVKQHVALKMRYGIVREECANLFERRSHMEQVEEPALASRYMLEIGQYEMHIFELGVEIHRWRRRFELRQRALNCGGVPDLIEIESALDEEFAELHRRILDSAKQVRRANAFFYLPKLTQAESTKMRLLYLDAAKRLHPDVNPEAGEAAAKLWHRIRKAYSDQNWSHLEFLVTLIDSVVAPPKEYPATEEGIVRLQEEIARLESVIAVQQGEIQAVKSHPPWCYEALLSNPGEIARRQERLQEEIADLLKQLKFYELKWEQELDHD